MPSSRGPSQPQDQTWISCTAGDFTAEPLGKAGNVLSRLERRIASPASLSARLRDLVAGKMSVNLRPLHFDLHTWTAGAGEPLGRAESTWASGSQVWAPRGHFRSPELGTAC